MSGSQRDPFRELQTLQDKMNRLFEEASRGAVPPGGLPQAHTWSPAVDVYETDTGIVLTAELPGLEREDIQLDLKDNTLILSGVREFVRAAGQDRYHRIERSYGSFSRSFSVPARIEAGDVDAEYKDGVLRVVLRKVRQPEPRQIPIRR